MLGATASAVVAPENDARKIVQLKMIVQNGTRTVGQTYNLAENGH